MNAGRLASVTDSGWSERLGAVRVAAAEAAQLAASSAARSVLLSDWVRHTLLHPFSLKVVLLRMPSDFLGQFYMPALHVRRGQGMLSQALTFQTLGTSRV